MQIYLPIAEIPVNIILVLILGFGAGFYRACLELAVALLQLRF